MKTFLFSLAGLLIAFSHAHAQFPPLPAADLVLGAADFDTPGSAMVTATGMNAPQSIAIDPTSGAVFVADSNHNRVLRFTDFNSLSSGAAAEAVFGQTNFTESSPGLSATKFDFPSGVHVDLSGRLWISDSNNRVLMYEDASNIASNSAADLVLGQPDFDTGTAGSAANEMNSPFNVTVDSNDNLWVADRGNSRVLKFATVSTLANGAAATVVLGQTGFGVNIEATSATAMDTPVSVAVDAFDNLWVCDEGNHRVLRFSNASLLSSGSAADGVLGQLDFISTETTPVVRSFDNPTTLIIDPQGTLWVNDYLNHRVLLFKKARLKSNGATADEVIGQSDFASSSPGVSARKIQGPYGSALDPVGRLWVCDSENNRVLRFSPDKIRPLLTVKKVQRKTSKTRLRIKGTASDANGIASVRYRIGKAPLKAARGTSSWSFNAKLKTGLNKLEIQATDSAGNLSASKRIKVRRG